MATKGFLWSAVGFVAAAAAAAAAEIVNGDLLRQPDVTLAPVRDGITIANAAALCDGDLDTVAVIAGPLDAGVDLAVAWPGRPLTLKKLFITLDPAHEEAKPREVEVLVSPDAEGERFTVARSADIRGAKGPFVYRIDDGRAVRARLRLVPAAGAREIRVAELALLAEAEQVAPPGEVVAGREAAAAVVEAFQRAAPELAPPADEAAMLADGGDGRFDDVSFAVAALMASGVADAAARGRHAQTVDGIVERASRAVGTGDAFARGDRLLRFLHADVFRKGYVERQTDVAVVLEQGTFNCVSSAVVFNIVGRRLGLDLRGIEVPEHAFSILYDGARHADAETTVAEGFDPARNPDAVERLQARTGFAYIPESDRDARREVTDSGMVAIIYHNRGVVAAEQGRHADAFAMTLRCLALDPRPGRAERSMLAACLRWAGDLVHRADFEKAAAVLVAAVAWLPDERSLWEQWQFVLQERLRAAEGDVAAEAIARRALDDFPQRHVTAEVIAGHLHRRLGPLVDAGKFAEAEAYLDASRGLIEAARRNRLHEELHERLFVAWAAPQIDSDWERAVEIYSRGVGRAPQSSDLRDNLEFCFDKWARTFFDKDWPRAAEIYARGSAVLPTSSLLRENAESCRARAGQ